MDLPHFLPGFANLINTRLPSFPFLSLNPEIKIYGYKKKHLDSFRVHKHFFVYLCFFFLVFLNFWLNLLFYDES